MDLIDLSLLDGKDEGFVTFLDTLCDQYGFDYAAYATANPIVGTMQGYATYPDEWKTHYAESGFHRIDPTLHMSARSIAPVNWDRLDRDKKFLSVFSHAHDFGISDRGLTIPVRGPYGECGLLSVTLNCGDSDWEKHTRHHASDLQMAAVVLHDSVMQTDSLSRILRRPALSAREREILQWVAVGKSQQDIGDILSISHRTVEVHIRSSRDKLAALTTAQAIGRAISFGIIHPG
ncbi:LuxR family transcriptional regulator [Thalassovita taeanensis]|uniref:DNA-binding transcriptional regulator, CsgD family n=1 Tax=Thalassovita taeanensis TaxID=657014 RepID=A0A1H9HRJ9_9RHOB|nr:LuxR family transcriptional regulator [Thalassovita taeanensis]SEQ64980.1 DNA-binding transcriptional regulator, CsgD family [Thalassovita taeanensis]